MNPRFMGLFLCRALSGVLQGGRLDDFHPVGVRVFHEGQAFHATVGQAFLKLDAQFFETRASSTNIRYRDADMAEATWVGIAVVVGKVGIAFSAMVVGQ